LPDPFSSIDTGYFTDAYTMLPVPGKERETQTTYLNGHIGLSIPVAFIGWIIPTIVPKFKILAAAASIWFGSTFLSNTLILYEALFAFPTDSAERLLRIASKPNQIRTYVCIVRPPCLQVKVKRHLKAIFF
jgi:hypothetical protein